jgi:plasmid maintenance system killer protein
MEVDYGNEDLRRLANDAGFSIGLPRHVESLYRTRITYLMAATDERALYAMAGSLNYKKLKGQDRLRTIRVNQKYRIKLEVVESAEGNVLRILDVGDFHDD